ncbi:MAG: putative toxin-antitoxin system toxin component, PIN family [Nitrospirae bacterium]|nr:putative toxin-antitoxin system toxin component, PIN family [Nitrospirota bacterium]
MRVVLDTNVIVAAFASRGLCSEVFEVCLSDHTIIISEHILSEVKEKLISKIHLPHNITYAIINYLKEVAEIFEAEPIYENICKDKDDIKILGTALSGNARFIITGDEDLLILKRYRKTEIVSPREFWGHLSGKARLEDKER